MARLGSIAVAAAFAMAAAVPGSAAAQAIPTPDNDPFYDAPTGFESKAPGAVLRSRPVTVKLGAAPIPAKAWQLLFRSTDTKDRPIASIATVLVPHTPYSGRRPLLSYQVAIDSLGSHCNPGYTMRTGSQRETFAIQPALAAGWAVVVPDFEGPRNAYGAGLIAARITLDGIRAAERFGPAKLAGRATPVGMWGYSGGGQATAWAAEQQPGYASELNVVGVAEGGVPPYLDEVARQIDGGPFFGVYFAVAVGLSREYPETNFDSLLNDRGKALKREIEDDCSELVTKYPFRRMRDHVNVPELLEVPEAKRVIAANALGKATPSAPLFIYHSALDQLVPVTGPDRLVPEYCRGGATVFYRRDVAGEHVAYAVTGGAQAFAYLAARFAGLPPPRSCSGSASPPPAAGAPDRRPACLARRSPIGTRNIGRVRLGYTRRRLLRRLPVAPVHRGRYAFIYCVKGGPGRVTAVFSHRSRRGRVQLVMTTARGHSSRRVRAGSRARRLRRAFPHRLRIGRGVYRAGPRSRRLFRLRRGRVRYIAVADRRLLRTRAALRRALRRRSGG